MDNCLTHNLRLCKTHRYTKMGFRVHIDTYIEFLKWVSDHSMQIETLKFWSLDNCSDYLIHIYTLNHESWLIVWHAVVWYFWVHIDNLIWVSDCPINIDTQKYVSEYFKPIDTLKSPYVLLGKSNILFLELNLNK